MPNSLITLADGDETITESTVMVALGALPFLSHQFRWFVSTVAQASADKGLSMLKTYGGTRKEKPYREARFQEILKVVQSLSGARLGGLPERIPLGASVEDIKRLLKT